MGKIVLCRSNPVDPDPRAEKAAFALQNAGHQVTILAWNRCGSMIDHIESDKDIKIIRLTIPGKFGAGLANLKPFLKWQIKELLWLWNYRNTYEIIHACDFDTVVPAVIVKILLKKRVVYDIYDFFTDHVQLKHNALVKFIRWLDYQIVNFVDGVIIVDDSRKIQLGKIKPKRLVIVYNTPSDRPDLLNQDIIENKYRLHIAYVGVILLDRGLKTLIELLATHPEWKFDFAGFGGDEEEILQNIEMYPNITWHGRVSYTNALLIYSRSDVIIATYDPSVPNNRLSSPNKIFEAMMLSKPVVVANLTKIDEFVKRFKTGLSVSYGDRKALELALIYLETQPKIRMMFGANGRKLYEKFYNWNIMEYRLLDLYKNILSQ